MLDQPDLTRDAVLRALTATAHRLITEQSAALARARSAIERAMERLREPDGDGVCVAAASRDLVRQGREVPGH